MLDFFLGGVTLTSNATIVCICRKPVHSPVLLHLSLTEGARALTKNSYKHFFVPNSAKYKRLPWTTVCEALSALGKAVAKGKRAEAKAKSKLDAKKSRNEGPQQRTLLQTLSRATKMKNGPTASSARLLQDIVPSSILQHIFVVGSLSPIDLCSAGFVYRLEECYKRRKDFYALHNDQHARARRYFAHCNRTGTFFALDRASISR